MAQPSADNTTSIRDLRKNLSELLNRTKYAGERLIVTRRDRPVAALVPIEDIAVLQEIEQRVDLDAAREALEDYEENGGVQWAELKKELGL